VATHPVGSTSISIMMYTNNDANRKMYLSITGQFHAQFGRRCKKKRWSEVREAGYVGQVDQKTK